MFEAILFDLDGTLLDIDMNFFLTKYFGEMSKMAAISGCCDPGQLVTQILESTEVMIGDLNPRTRNEEVFMGHFFSRLKTDEIRMRAFFDDFYCTGFPRLQEYCRPFQGIPQMMKKVFKEGYKVVIATNSVFPQKAIQTRLDWAGVGNFPYELLTCYENMHYCKPHLQYYQEIADNLGVEPAACLMVGNDTNEDLAAGKIGMKTFLVENCLIDQGNNTCRPDWRGSLQDFFKFIDDLRYNSVGQV
ncbi:MAG: HAD family hydrolase [Syntrophomonadaceae bacterium]|nr:HAD family hydrolase [Syntrophomonadaceae bacterium]